MHLSRLLLDPRNTQVQRDLADAGRLHQRIMAGFPHVETAGARAALGVLHRVDVDLDTGAPTLLVQSLGAPDWSHLPAGYVRRPPETKPVGHFYDGIQESQRLAFCLRANPAKRVARSVPLEGQVSRHGPRVPLRGQEAQRSWLARQGQRFGFSLEAEDGAPLPLLIVPDAQKRRAKIKNIVYEAVTFNGYLRVTDGEAFRRALAKGIGPEKAYGCGLLSVRPAYDY